MIIEIDRKILKSECNNNIETALKEGWILDWNPERIKNAFAFGNGTEKDLKRYMNDNKQFAIFIER